ncbi:MAG: 30S ribosomal protein S2 [candidate division SR1 bacterium]|nr:MAG: 30S ribosomal protein S2 [candidate division SR1 bacterium]
MAITAKQIIDSGAHIGTLKREAHPKTSKFWLGVNNSLVVLDPEKMAEQLEAIKTKVQECKKENKKILVVSEKKMFTDEVKKLCEDKGVFYLNQKVPGGFLSNFPTLMKRIDSLNEMKRFIDSESFEMLTKKEQAIYRRKYKKVDSIYSGVAKLSARPDLVIVVDGMQMKGFVKELKGLQNIDAVIMAGTNFDSYVGKYDVIANMFSYKALNFMLTTILS